MESLTCTIGGTCGVERVNPPSMVPGSRVRESDMYAVTELSRKSHSDRCLFRL
ncbi:hypothetical protein WN55_07536 [Dufourea novaeangliae]|uniref:Uncharacterized protein n=1 Tax=Dufourea novaeangliae TaxID=178035 RepID=A0A154P4I5_DUFNO|nr:hypothetical protein WN55_07536 [Dufourea novaeangliae]